MEKTKPRLVGNVKWFSNKPKKRRARRSPRQLAAFRVAQLRNLYRARYRGELFSNDDAGRDDLYVLLCHLAKLNHAKWLIARTIETWAPWLTAGEQKELVPPILADPRCWTADELGWRIRLTKEERTMLGITTIGAFDQPKSARTKRRRQRDRIRKINQRRAAGAKTRAEYEQQSLARAKPWELEGISRATWYRRRATETSQP